MCVFGNIFCIFLAALTVGWENKKKGEKTEKKMFLRVEKEKKFFDQKIRENLCKIKNIFITFQFNSKSFLNPS